MTSFGRTGWRGVVAAGDCFLNCGVLHGYCVDDRAVEHRVSVSRLSANPARLAAADRQSHTRRRWKQGHGRRRDPRPRGCKFVVLPGARRGSGLLSGVNCRSAAAAADAAAAAAAAAATAASRSSRRLPLLLMPSCGPIPPAQCPLAPAPSTHQLPDLCAPCSDHVHSGLVDGYVYVADGCVTQRVQIRVPAADWVHDQADDSAGNGPCGSRAGGHG